MRFRKKRMGVLKSKKNSILATLYPFNAATTWLKSLGLKGPEAGSLILVPVWPRYCAISCDWAAQPGRKVKG
jgi:hypothetical protein